MRFITVKGGKPLLGDVIVNGSEIAAEVILVASLFSNENIVISNISRSQKVLSIVDFINDLGGKIEWVGSNKLCVNCAGLRVLEKQSSVKTLPLLITVPFLFRFGGVKFPRALIDEKDILELKGAEKKFFNLGIKYLISSDFVEMHIAKPSVGAISLENASVKEVAFWMMVLSFISGESTINNVCDSPIIDDLVSFFNLIGGDIVKDSPKTIKIVGNNLFKGGEFTLSGSRLETVFFSAGAILTSGNVAVRGISRDSIVDFINKLSQLGVGYEFSNDELRVWPSGNPLQPINVKGSPYVTLILTKVFGESLVTAGSIDSFEYIKDLNRMGARINSPEQSTNGYTIKISGPIKLQGTKLHVTDSCSGLVLLLAALSAEGKSEITGYESIEKAYPGIYAKLLDLGADIE